VTARSSKMLENVAVEFKLGDSTTGAECTHTGGGGQSAGGAFGALTVNGGSVRWAYDPQTKVRRNDMRPWTWVGLTEVGIEMGYPLAHGNGSAFEGVFYFQVCAYISRPVIQHSV
jgi:hypothetical protein